MYRIKKDINKNRLYLTISGIVSITEAKKIKDELEKEVEDMRPNFDLINDISRFIHGQEEAGSVLSEIMKFLISKNVNRVVRVVGNSKEGLIQFANYSLSIEAYQLKYVPTLEEAEKFLDGK